MNILRLTAAVLLLTLCSSFLIVKAQNNPIAHWKLDETSGTTVADELGTSNGTLVNGADSLWVQGWDGNALDFSKKLGAYVEVPDNDIVEFDSTESFTISMLIKADPVDNTAEQEILMKGAFGVDASQGWEGKWYGMQFKGGEVRLAVDDNINKTQLGVDISAIWPSNRWAHLVGVRDVGSGMLKLYLNGVLIGEMEDATKNDIASGDLPMLMGLNYQGLSPLDGQLDDVRFYNYPLNPAAVDSLFESYGIQKDVMLAYWKFNESSGTTVADQLGSSDGTLVNGADSMWVEGWDGNALDFSKKLGGYVEVPDKNNVLEFDSTDSFTISMLIKADPVGNTAEQEIIIKGAFGVDASQGWAGKWYGMQFKGGEVRLAVDDNITKTQLGVDISTMWPSNQWAYLVGVRDITAGMLRLYLNGKLIGEMPDGTVNDIASDSLPVLMGINYQGLSPLDGQIDELKIFNYPMNAAAVKAMYDEYALNPALAAYWKFDESSGTTVADSLGNSNGMLINGADSLWVQGWDGNALDFSKILGAYVEVPDNDFVEFDSTESFSISMLIKADPVVNTAEQEIIMKGAFGVDSSQDWFGKWYGMQFKGGEVRLAVDDNITKTQLGVDISNIWPSNEWAQLVGVRDLNEDSLKLYLNGKWIGSIEDGTENDIASDTLPLLMGINYQGLSPLDGQLDNVKLYNYALSPNAVQALFDESGIIVSVNGDDNQSVPTKFALEQNYPNPFNPSTKIKYSIPTSSKVKLIVYDILGRKVAELVNQVQNAGYYEVNFNASNLSSGVYFYRISYSNQFLTKKMLLLK